MRERFLQLLPTIEREAWIRLFVAVFGLALAFITALLSTAAREAGNRLATAILASASLLLALVVGLITVPYLARRVAAHTVRDVLDYDVTHEGIAYIAITFIIALAALNTGNNLLFIVVSAMLAAIIVSGIASAFVLRGVKVSMELPVQVFARESYLAQLTLSNHRRWLAALSITVVPEKTTAKQTWKWKRTMFEYPKRKPGRKVWIRWPDISVTRVREKQLSSRILRDPVYFPFVSAKQSVMTEVELTFPKRGVYRQDQLGVSTRFPFSFLKKTRQIQLAQEIVVYPSIEPTDELFEVLPIISGEFESYQRGRGVDLYRIRDYQPEDSVRHVDWKSTAKAGTIKVREFTREDERRLRIVFDNPRPGALSSETYECGVELAASLAWHFSHENAELSFAISNSSVTPDLNIFLTSLAKIAPSEEIDLLESNLATDQYNLVITSRRKGAIPTHLWQDSYFIFLSDK